MKSPTLAAAIAAVCLTGAACAQDVITRTKKDGNARTTTIIPVVAPNVANPAPAGKPNSPLDPAPGEAKGVVVNVKSWVCGQQFTDDKGVTWCRVFGPREASKPDKLAGWMIRARDGKLLFVTIDGTVFVPCPPGPVVTPKPPLGAELMKQLEGLAKEQKEEQKK